MPYSITISDNARSILHEISQQEKTSIQTVLEKAIENYRRLYVLTQTNKAYAKLRKNPTVWEEEIQERRSWEATKSDDFKTALLAMPNVGEDTDFEREQDYGRNIV